MMKSSQSTANDGPRTWSSHRERTRTTRTSRRISQAPTGAGLLRGQLDGDAYALNRYVPEQAHSYVRRPTTAKQGGPMSDGVQPADDFTSNSLLSNTFGSREGRGSSWNNLLSPLNQLLAPPAIPCLTCGKTISDRVRGYPEICLSCYLSIPWIKSPRCRICGRQIGCPDCTRTGQAIRSFVMNRSAVAYNPAMREWLAQYKFRGNEAYGAVLARMTGATYRRMIDELIEAGATGGGSGIPFRFHAVTPVPVSKDRMQERGFNQAARLAYGAASAGSIPMLNLLERTRHTEKQSFKTRWERLHDLHDVFKPAAQAEVKLLTALEGSKRKPNKSFYRKPSWVRATPKGMGFASTDFRSPGGSAERLDPFSRILPDPSPEPVRFLLVDDVYTTGSTLEACARALHELCGYIGRYAEIYCLTWARS